MSISWQSGQALSGAGEVLYHASMTRHLNVHLLPSLFEPSDLEGGIAVVIDVLRATTTIAYALEHGALGIIPCESIEEAVAQRDIKRDEGNSARADSERMLLGGEREGEPISGFDLSNSPSEWTSEAVSNREIAFTTTNGTRALLRSTKAARIVTGAFANLRAVVDFLSAESRPVHLVCAGTVGKVSTEDSLFAGAIVDHLLRCQPEDGEAVWELCDASRLVLAHWKEAAESHDGLFHAMKSGSGGRNLMRLDLEADIRMAAMLDQVDLVPEYLPQSRRIGRADQKSA